MAEGLAVKNIPVPQIKFGKRKTRSQMFEILTIDGRWIDVELPVSFNCSDDEARGGAFLLDSDNQYEAEDGTMHQIVSEKSLIPICMISQSKLLDGKNDDAELKKISEDVFNLTFEQKKAEQFAKLKKNEIWDKALWIVSIVCGTFLVIAAFNYFG